MYRYGQLYKSNRPDGPMDFFHNTCLVRRQNTTAGYLLFRHSTAVNKVRRSANNIFVDVDPAGDDAEYATTFLPDPLFAGPTDANYYRQIGGGTPRPVVRHVGWDGHDPQTHLTLETYRQSSHFVTSKAGYPPGFENDGIDADPQFQSIASDGSPSTTDDLRLTDGSPATQAGLALDGPPTGIVDPLADPVAPLTSGVTRPDRTAPSSMARPSTFRRSRTPTSRTGTALVRTEAPVAEAAGVRLDLCAMTVSGDVNEPAQTMLTVSGGTDDEAATVPDDITEPPCMTRPWSWLRRRYEQLVPRHDLRSC